MQAHTSKTPFVPRGPAALDTGLTFHWLDFALIMAAAIALRLLFANGPLGSDDVTYLGRAAELGEGHWRNANYNGALRYGYNAPQALLIAIFGTGMLAVNLWPLMCSVFEVAVVYHFAAATWGRRHAALAAILLVVTPLHVAAAMRIHADPVASAFLTLTFALFFFAERRNSKWLYFASGLGIGMVFWVKELLAIAVLALAFYPFVWRRFSLRWLYFCAGGLVMLLAHFVLMQSLAGDPLHLFRVVFGQIRTSFLGEMNGEDTALYYFRYLLLDLKHTWLLGPMALVAMVLWLRRPVRPDEPAPGALSYAVFWTLSLLIVLSFLPVSFSPFRLTLKQSNYLTLFLGPLALLAGYLLAEVGPRVRLALLSLFVLGGVVLSALEQQAYRVFTSNGSAIVSYLRQHPDTYVMGSTNNGNIVTIHSIILGDPSILKRFTYYNDVPGDDYAEVVKKAAGHELVAYIDRETLGWGTRPDRLTSPRACWQKVGDLAPESLGAGNLLTQALVRWSAFMPAALGERVRGSMKPLAQPRQATLYRVDPQDPNCSKAASAS